MTIFEFRGETTYILGRVAALSSRPLMLLSANHFAGNDTASMIAVVFVVIILAAAAISFHSHRTFYKAFFSKERQRSRGFYQTYVNASIFQILVLILPLLIFILWQHQQLIFAVAVVIYFVSERLADESQRFLIFYNMRAEWGYKILLKAFIQVCAVTTACITFGSTDQAATFAVLALAIGNLVPFIGHIPWKYFPKNWSSIFKAWRNCWNQVLFWALSFATALITYMDRIIVMLFQQSDMAIFTLLVSSLSLIQNAIDYFYVSLRRRKILQARVTLSQVFLSKNLYIITVISSIFGIVLCLGLVYLYQGQSIGNWTLIFIVLISQIALALTLVVREMAYWNHDIISLIKIEGSFVLAVLLLIFGLYYNGSEYVTLLAALSIMTMGRLLFISRLVRRKTSEY